MPIEMEKDPTTTTSSSESNHKKEKLEMRKTIAKDRSLTWLDQKSNSDKLKWKKKSLTQTTSHFTYSRGSKAEKKTTRHKAHMQSIAMQ